MARLIILLLVTALVCCTLDPSKIPMFKTNLSLSFPVYRPKVTIPNGQALTDPYAINDLLAVNPYFLSKYTVTTQEITQQVLPVGFPKTKVYAYGGDCYDSLSGESLGTVHGWPGPAFFLQRYGRVETTWRNGLKGKHMFAIQRNLDFMRQGIDFDSFIPNVAHIHGMANPSKSDGVPEAWFTNDGQQGDHYFTNSNPQLRNESVYPMANQQEEATMFYHDHSMAMTRLNLYAGLAGMVAIQDSQSPLSRMFDRKHDIFLAIADRSFNEDGSLYYPSKGATTQFPNWVPQFFGDVMTVNGKAYPNLNIEQNRYRVRILNACNSRGLTISFLAEATNQILPFILYKSDSCYHYQPLQLYSLDMPVAGRAEIILDFTKITKGKVIMRNVPLPNPQQKDFTDPLLNVSNVAGLGLPNLLTTNNITNNLIQEINNLNPIGNGVNSKFAQPIPAGPGSGKLASTDYIMSFTPNIKVTVPIAAPTLTVTTNNNLFLFPFLATNLEIRHYTLYQVKNQNGDPLGVFINGAKMRGQSDVFQMSKEYELWLINLTEDTHPIHMHLVNFQFYKQASFDKDRYTKDWLAKNQGSPPYTKAVKVLAPDQYLTTGWVTLGGVHRVWRDMVNAASEVVTVIRLRFKYNTGMSYPADVKGSRYVMHCHIVEHEDNEMMRYFSVE